VTVPRLFVTDGLSSGLEIQLDQDQSHYLTTVLRRKLGAEVLLFNGRDGEFATRIVRQARAGVALTVGPRLRPYVETATEITLIWAPIRGDRADYVLEKATELGVSAIIPVATDHGVVKRFNVARAWSRLIEAAEQSERLDVPRIDSMQMLDEAATRAVQEGPLLWGDSAGARTPAGGGPKPLQLVAASIGAKDPAPASISVLIGPEGGFSESETRMLRELGGAEAFSLGRRILRADTAVYAALTLIQTLAGDSG
jgi:16S rRNA (uracil1498-N3)-methyltransferase